MAEPVILYHNPRCGKSRQALSLLRERGVEPQIVLYLEQPPSRERLVELLAWLGLEPKDLLRATEPLARALELTAASEPEAILEALAAHPELLERPLAVRGEQAVVGRPPERVLALLGG